MGYAKYVVRYSRKIQPGTEVDIICEAPPNQMGRPYTALVEGFPNSASSLRIGHIIADVGKNLRVPVRICNISARPIIVQKKLSDSSSFICPENR